MASGADKMDEGLASFYLDNLCPEADHAYRIGFALCLNREGGLQIVEAVFKKLINNLEALKGQSSEILRREVLRLSWEEFKALGDKFPAEPSKIANFFSTLSPEARAAVVAIDVDGFGLQDFAAIIGAPPVAALAHLAAGRRGLVNLAGPRPEPTKVEDAEGSPKKTPEITEDQVYANLAHYLNGEISAGDRALIEAGIQRLNYPNLAEVFGTVRGFLQVSLQRYSLSESEIWIIRAFVEGRADRESLEAKKIERFDKKESLAKILGRSAVVGVLLGIIFGVVYWLTPAKKNQFKPLETLVYEAIAIEEDGESRLNFPSDNLSQATDFLQQSPNLGFVVPDFAPPPHLWDVKGATIIDYEVAKIAAMEFANASLKENVMLFLYQGFLVQLPKAAVGNYKGLLYQTYETDRMNIVAWQIAPRVVGLMIGHRSAPELADFAQTIAGIGK